MVAFLLSSASLSLATTLVINIIFSFFYADFDSVVFDSPSFLSLLEVDVFAARLSISSRTVMGSINEDSQSQSEHSDAVTEQTAFRVIVQE